MSAVAAAAARVASAARANLPPDIAEAWLAMLAPGVRLTAAPESAALARGRWPWRRHRDPAGQDRPAIVGWLGGLPVLPEGTDWPAWEGHGPLAHVATLDCAGLRAALPGPLRNAGFPD